MKTYIYKGNPYRVVGDCRFKHPDTREWLDAVLYQRADIKSDLYVREKAEFERLFKLKTETK